MKVKRIYGALNIEFEGQKYVNFAVMDRKCDSCNTGDCEKCDESGKPWNEYYQLMKYGKDFKNDKTMYETDITEAVRGLVRMLQEYLDKEEEKTLCADSAK